jgi:hypothetical protein
LLQISRLWSWEESEGKEAQGALHGFLLILLTRLSCICSISSAAVSFLLSFFT